MHPPQPPEFLTSRLQELLKDLKEDVPSVIIIPLVLDSAQFWNFTIHLSLTLSISRSRSIYLSIYLFYLSISLSRSLSPPSPPTSSGILRAEDVKIYGDINGCQFDARFQ